MNTDDLTITDKQEAELAVRVLIQRGNSFEVHRTFDRSKQRATWHITIFGDDQAHREALQAIQRVQEAGRLANPDEIEDLETLTHTLADMGERIEQLQEINAGAARLASEAKLRDAARLKELAGLRRFEASVHEALNSGDGSYKP